LYKINEFAKLINVSTQTLRNWDKKGILKPILLNSKHRRYTDEHLSIIRNKKINISRKNICYIRESTKQQKNSLIEQENKMKEFCISKGLNIDLFYSEYGSALNYKRNKFQLLLKHILNNEIENLIIYYKDRLVRFGFEIIEYFSILNNFNIIIVDNSETNKTKEVEFSEDLISIIHYFSMKLYGSRSYKKKIKKCEDNINDIKTDILQDNTK